MLVTRVPLVSMAPEECSPVPNPHKLFVHTQVHQCPKTNSPANVGFQLFRDSKNQEKTCSEQASSEVLARFSCVRSGTSNTQRACHVRRYVTSGDQRWEPRARSAAVSWEPAQSCVPQSRALSLHLRSRLARWLIG